MNWSQIESGWKPAMRQELSSSAQKACGTGKKESAAAALAATLLGLRLIPIAPEKKR